MAENDSLTLVGFGLGGFITTVGGSFQALVGLESWYEGIEGPVGGTLPKSVVDGGIGVVCPIRIKRITILINLSREKVFVNKP